MMGKSCRSDDELKILAWAELVLPYLPPPALASISSSSKSLRRISKSITTQRASDASRALEKHPIPFINTFDNQPYSFFIYTPFSISPPSTSPSSPHPWGGKPSQNPHFFQKPTSYSVLDGGFGCDCLMGCNKNGVCGCPCWVLGMEEVMNECGEICACGSECSNRLTQMGVSVRLKIVKDERKGWGLFADQFVRKGEFVCEYAGELLTTKEARRRQQKYDHLASNPRFSSALLVVREHLPSGKACLRINIDSTRIGNVARFINHSCDGGNLSSLLVRSSGALVPRLCFFAARDICEGEELCFKYGDAMTKSKGQPCFCGSKACLGILPSEPT